VRHSRNSPCAFINATVIVALLAACSNTDVFAPSPTPSQKFAPTVLLGLNTSMPVRISEFHYDNVNGDTNEWIEVSGPGNMSLNGYSIVLYNGADGLSYSTRFLGGNIPLICSGRGVVLVMYAINGIQRLAGRDRAHRPGQLGHRVPLLRRIVHRGQWSRSRDDLGRHRRF
jgi:hypothetical protein